VGTSFHWRFGRTVLAPLLHLGLRLRIEGRENIVRDRPQIIACNHTSFVDPILAGYASGIETWFLAKQEVFDGSRFLAWLIRTYNTLPVRRGANDRTVLERCSAVLRQNRSLVLFPEGTRSRTGRFQPLKSGVARLAISNQVPVIPTYIRGLWQSFIPWMVDWDIVRYARIENPDGRRFRLASLWTSRVFVGFGRPLSPDGFGATREDYARFTEQLACSMGELAHPDLAYEPPRSPRTQRVSECS
jgi:1-acyl-sn-glycerol-3-phosphate acyltransferase